MRNKSPEEVERLHTGPSLAGVDHCKTHVI